MAILERRQGGPRRRWTYPPGPNHIETEDFRHGDLIRSTYAPPVEGDKRSSFATGTSAAAMTVRLSSQAKLARAEKLPKGGNNVPHLRNGVC